MTFELTILGCNSAVPSFGRHPSSQVLRVQEQYYLIDCGEGTQMRMLEYKIRKNKIKAIFISHLHGDHIYGLIGLLNSYNLAGRKERLDIYSPPGLEEIIRVHLKYAARPFVYPVSFHIVDTTQSQLIYEDECIDVISIPLIHRIPTTGYFIKEKQKPPGIIAEQLSRYQIPFQKIPEIKAGGDFVREDGTVIPHHELVYPPVAARSYAYCSDTMYTESYLEIIRGADLLYHESTFAHELLSLAIRTMHSTALQAATIARKAEVGKLILGHYSSRYRDTQVLQKEAQKVFVNTVAGEGGGIYPVVQK